MLCDVQCAKKPTPIELELANGNSAWAPKLKKSFSCAKCKSYILAKPIITKLPFTNPRIPVTHEIEVKKVLKALGYIDLQIRDYAESLKPTYGQSWTIDEYESLLNSPNDFAIGIKKRLGIKLSKIQINKISQLKIYRKGEEATLVHDDVDKIVDIHNAKPRSPLKKRKSILVSESSVENRLDEKKVDFTNTPVITELHNRIEQ